MRAAATYPYLSGRHFDVFDLALRLRYIQAVFTHAFEVEPDGFTNLILDLFDWPRLRRVQEDPGRTPNSCPAPAQ